MLHEYTAWIGYFANTKAIIFKVATSASLQLKPSNMLLAISRILHRFIQQKTCTFDLVIDRCRVTTANEWLLSYRLPCLKRVNKTNVPYVCMHC